MQRQILKNKNKITVVNAILIVVGFCKWTVGNIEILLGHW